MSSRKRVGGWSVAFGVTAIALAAGCEDSRNRINSLLGVEPGSIPALEVNPASSIPASDAASLDGLDRRAWDLVLVEVPRGQVQVKPTYMRNLNLASGSIRDEGIYPTLQTALDGTAEPESVLLEGVVQPFWASISLAGSPVLMARGEWPWSTQREPRGKYELVPAGQTPATAVNWAWVERPTQP